MVEEKNMQLTEKLNKISKRKRELEQFLEKAYELNSDDFIKYSKELAELTPVADAITSLTKKKNELNELNALLQDPSSEHEFKTLAKEEAFELKETINQLEKEIQVLLLPKDNADEKNAIIEIRAGTGGEEAALFAADLFSMYQRYADHKGWKFEVLSISETGIGGFKEISAQISGKSVFANLKFESGVHRVQRVPETEASGRIHTSAATVAVLPEAEEVDIKIEDKDLRVDVFRSSGPGGQSVNTTDSAVRITHIPTGLTVSQQDEKSQHKNKAKALKVLRSRLFEMERQKQMTERSQSRQQQIGSGDRSERIRTYNFPQGRVTDHRINLTLYKIDEILSGSGLDSLIGPIRAYDQAQKLAALNEKEES
jgi:peptide chain release factor 1